MKIIFSDVLNPILNDNLGYILYFLSFILISIYIIPISEFPYKMGGRKIFEYDKNWEYFKLENMGELNDWIIKNVEKMLKCKDKKLEYLKYRCKRCERIKIIKFCCNTQICSRCGKRYTDK